MSSQYRGVSTRLQNELLNHIHMWCYAHSLTLVLLEMAHCVSATISSFSLLQQTQVFIKKSHYDQIFIWNNIQMYERVKLGQPDGDIKVIPPIKYFASTIRGANVKMSNLIKVQIIENLYTWSYLSLSILHVSTHNSKSTHFSPKTWNKAYSLLQKFFPFETILTA